MRYFVFRNQTVEPFLGDKGIGYSGYDDISMVPEDAERYIWFYQVPFNMRSILTLISYAWYWHRLATRRCGCSHWSICFHLG